MIGIRVALAVGLATIGLALLLGSGRPEPGIEMAAQRLVAERAGRVDAALVALELGIMPGLEAARRASARVVAGDDQPGQLFREAAASLAAVDADQVRDGVAGLDGARRAAVPGAAGLEAPVEEGELASIASQLDGTATAGDEFVAMRLRAERLTATLDDALAALERDDGAAAGERIAEARADHDAIVGWDVELVTLPVWVETMDAMIGAIERLVAATREGDADEAASAASDLAAVADEAATADRALRIAIGEGGGSIASAPLARLADLLGRVRDARATMALILQTAGR